MSAADKHPPPAEGRPLQVLMGFCPAGRKDTEAVVRRLIDRHFDLPVISWFYLQRHKDGLGYYYEAHEGGDGHAYLPSVLERLEHADDTSVVVRAGCGRAAEVRRQTEGPGIRLTLMPENYPREETLGITRSKRMTPFLPNRRGVMLAGVASLAVSALLFTTAGVVHKAIGLYAAGYYEAAIELPIGRIAQLMPGYNGRALESAARRGTPIQRWDQLMQSVPAGDYVTQLYLRDGTWAIELASQRAQRESELEAAAARLSAAQDAAAKQDASAPAAVPTHTEEQGDDT